MNASTEIKVSVYIATSLDGFIAREDGGIAWLHDAPPPEDGDDAGFGAFLASIDVLVMGRGSFEKVMEFDQWAYGTTPIVVLSRSLKALPDKARDSVRLENAAPQELLQKLEAEDFKHVYLDGGLIVQSFIREGLVDEITLTTIPVLIGSGRPLFGELDEDVKLRLLESKSWTNGFVQSRYQIVKN